MPQIEISERDFNRLQRVARPLIDTAATAFSRVMDVYDRHGETVAQRPDVDQPNVREFSPDTPPPLVHTKLLAGDFAGKQPDRSTWDALLRLALVQTFEKCIDVGALGAISGANLASGKKVTEGFKPLEGYPFSYQGMSAESAAACVMRCARYLGSSARLEFEWRRKKGAFAPGQRGVIRMAP